MNLKIKKTKNDDMVTYLGLAIMAVLSLVFILVNSNIKNVRADSNPGTNVTSTDGNYWAWNDLAGWINFHDSHSVFISSQDVDGYATSSGGEISFNCETTSVGNICGFSNYRVLNNGSGLLSGWAWSDLLGWVSLSCTNPEGYGCGASLYRTQLVSIIPNEPPSGFRDWAWNDLAGWVIFDCADGGLCGVSDFHVLTDWFITSTFGYLDSITYDTGVVNGAQFNAIMWRGEKPIGTEVYFQLATSNSDSGPWVFFGSDGVDSYYIPELSQDGETYYAAITNAESHSNKRYFRYRIWLISNSIQTATPRVDKIIINWSP